jgi:hypothetical protein
MAAAVTISNTMDDPNDLVLGMFALAVTAVMLVAGELYLVTRPDQPKTLTPPASRVTSSIRLTWCLHVNAS